MEGCGGEGVGVDLFSLSPLHPHREFRQHITNETVFQISRGLRQYSLFSPPPQNPAKEAEIRAIP